MVRAGDKLLLIGATDQNVSLISSIELKEEQATEKAQKELESKVIPVSNIGNEYSAILDEKDPAQSSPLSFFNILEFV